MQHAITIWTKQSKNMKWQNDRSVRPLVAVFIKLSIKKLLSVKELTLGTSSRSWLRGLKFVFQTASPVREQSMQNVVLVPQTNCCPYLQWVRLLWGYRNDTVQNCLHSLPISRRSKAHQAFAAYVSLTTTTHRKTVCVSSWHMLCARSVLIACTDCAHELTIFCTWSLTDSLSDMVTLSIFIQREHNESLAGIALR